LCGNFGIAGPGIILQDLSNFRNMGYASQNRGMDGAGVFQVNTFGNAKKNRNELLFKSQFDFTYMEWEAGTKAKELMNRVNCTAVMGHVRAKTRGDTSVENSHPFMFESIVGFHNGTLVDTKYNPLSEEKTDSELMFEDIERRGIVKVINELDEKSAYAIQMYNRDDRKVYFLRNEKRPLAFALLEDRHVLYWASEGGLLTYILNRVGLKHKLFYLRAGMLVSIDPKTINSKNDPVLKLEHSFIKEEVVVVKEPEPISVVVNLRKKLGRAAVPVEIKGLQEDNKLNNLFVKCSCGQHHLNLYDSFYIRKGSNSTAYPKYDVVTDTYDCVNCDKNVEKKEAMQ